MNNLTNLFTTIAQVSFGLAGLFFVALTINEQQKTRWLDDKNVSFVAFSFLMIVLPGIISLTGLIPYINSNILSMVALVFYGMMLLVGLPKIRKNTEATRAERSKWKWLQRIWDVREHTVLLSTLWFLCIFIPPPSGHFAVGCTLVLSFFLYNRNIYAVS